MGVRELPATVGQRLLWMIEHYRADYGSLSCPLVCRLRGPLDHAALQRAVDALGARHEALRLTFEGRGPSLRQVVNDPRPLPVRRADLSGRDDPETALAEALAGELATRVDTSVWPLRAVLWRLAAGDHALCLNMHHLVADAWSCGVLFEELRLCYERARGGQATLPAPGWSYTRFVEDQQALLVGDGLARHRDYWRQRLDGLPPPPLARGTAGRGGAGPAPSAVHVDLDRRATAALRALAQQRGTTPFAAMLAPFYEVLRRETGQDDLAVASLFANRARPQVRRTVGFLANMVVLRTRLEGASTFARLLAATHETVIGAFAHQELPYQMLPVGTAGARGRQDDLVFHVMADPGFRQRAAGVDFELVVPEDMGSRFPLELALAPVGEQMRAVLFSTGEILDRREAAGLLETYAALAEAVASAPDAPLART